jgi:hypothetical protein
MDSTQIIELVKSAALSLSAIVNDNANKFTKDQISKLMPTTIEFMSAMSLATAKISSQEKEIALLTQRLDSVERSPNGNSTLQVCNALAELAERTERAKNIIMFNVPELNTTGPSYISEEKKQIDDIISESEIPLTHNIIRFQRLGQRNEKKIRPIKITLNSSDDAKSLIYGKKKFPPNIKIKQDYTIMQRNHLRELWSEVESRKGKGEDNISIKFFNDTPRIVANRKNY